MQFAGWSSADLPTGGGIASYRNYVYATDAKTQTDTLADRGIVRYNLATETFERFHSQHGDIVDLNVGLDGCCTRWDLPGSGRATRRIWRFLGRASPRRSGELVRKRRRRTQHRAQLRVFRVRESGRRSTASPIIPLTAVVRGW